MNGVFSNPIFKVDAVTTNPVACGRKALMPFLLMIAVCLVGGFTGQARAQAVHDQGTDLNDAVSSPGRIDFSKLEDSEEIMNTPQIGFGSIGSLAEAKNPAAPDSVCSLSRAGGRIKNKLADC